MSVFAAVARSDRINEVVASTQLLADAELGEDAAQQVVGAECARDLVQMVLREAQIFRQQFACAAFTQRVTASFALSERASQCVEVTEPGHEGAFSAVKTHVFGEVALEQIDAIALISGEGEVDAERGLPRGGRTAAQVDLVVDDGER